MAGVNERLKEAAKAGSTVELKALLRDPGCNALSRDEHGMTALMWAAMFGREACVRVLLPISGAVTQSKNGLTALMHAAYSGHEGCVGLLLPASDALAKDVGGMTALMWAARYGHERCVGILLSASDALARDASGRTASQWAKSLGHESVAPFIDAYTLALSEANVIGGAVSSGSPRGRPVLRV